MAGAFFVAIFLFALTRDDPVEAWNLLYVIPIVLVASTAGVNGGLVAGCLATGLTAAWTQIQGVHLGVGGPVRAAVFIGCGVVAGAGARRASGDAAADVKEARRRESQKRAGLGTWELDLRTGHFEWSEEYQRLFGVDPQKFVSSRAVFEEIVVPEDRGLVSEALERIIRDSTSLEIRYRIVRPSDGAERCIRSHITADLDSAGEPVRVLGTGQDVTDLVMVLSPREREMLMLLAEGMRRMSRSPWNFVVAIR